MVPVPPQEPECAKAMRPAGENPAGWQARDRGAVARKVGIASFAGLTNYSNLSRSRPNPPDWFRVADRPDTTATACRFVALCQSGFYWPHQLFGDTNRILLQIAILGASGPARRFLWWIDEGVKSANLLNLITSTSRPGTTGSALAGPNPQSSLPTP